jgi:glutamate formiminotransferase/glutamate formiminotransferase/formiminotetrahydrofolate cyclodeaminase
MEPMRLLAVPNFSEGRDAGRVQGLARALTGDASAPVAGQMTPPPSATADGVRLLDVHSDPDHHRSVFTLAASPRILSDALLRAATVAVEQIDVMGPAGRGATDAGQHPHVGALDVAPVVYLEQDQRGAACAEALVLADRIGDELGVPVFLYGELTAAQGSPQRTRAELRRGGVAGLAQRMGEGSGALAPDFGPRRLHPRAGATLVAARPPLVAFNLLLGPPADLARARIVAATIREGGERGLPGVRAIGVALAGKGAQVSVNVERPLEVTLGEVVEAVRRQARVAACELVGLAPGATLEGFPEDVVIEGFDPAGQVIENALGP